MTKFVSWSFFAVLEGLYKSGVQDDVVDSIIGPKSDVNDDALMKERMQRSFVMDCPLCQPTFEAFLAYQTRPRFNDGSGESNFGDGLDETVRTAMLDETTSTRIMALKGPVQEWILNKLQARNLTNEQMAEWTQRINGRFNQGRERLMELMSAEPAYQHWQVYWGCAACNASRDANAQLRAEK